MPNRLIREGLLDSERYWSVSIEARQLFVHLMLLADDFGCVSLAPVFVRRRCFADNPPKERVDKLLNELAKVDLIRPYLEDHYAFIPRFGQRCQRNTLKHPRPPDSVLVDDDAALQLFSTIREGRRQSTAAQPLSNSSPSSVQPTKRSEEKRSEEKGRGSEEKGKEEKREEKGNQTAEGASPPAPPGFIPPPSTPNGNGNGEHRSQETVGADDTRDLILKAGDLGMSQANGEDLPTFVSRVRVEVARREVRKLTNAKTASK